MEKINDGYSVIDASVTKEQLEKIEAYNKFRLDKLQTRHKKESK